jgi:hypothetical protein
MREKKSKSKWGTDKNEKNISSLYKIEELKFSKGGTDKSIRKQPPSLP